LPTCSASARASGSNRADASAMSRSISTAPQESIRAATRRSTCAAASWVRPWVAWARRRARQGATSSLCTRAQVFGSRWARSRASARSCIPVNVDTPRAAANGSGAKAETVGQPSPPRDSSQSPSPGIAASPQTASPVSSVAGWSTHHRSASSSFASPARRSAVSASPTPASTASGSRCSIPVVATAVRMAIRVLDQRAPTVRSRKQGSAQRPRELPKKRTTGLARS
jgi:hypothetical protein